MCSAPRAPVPCRPVFRHCTYPLLGAGVHCFSLSTRHLALIVISVKLHQLINEAQIYFVFLSVGQNGFAKVRCKGGSSFASLWFERWLVWACKCAYDCALAYLNYLYHLVTNYKFPKCQVSLVQERQFVHCLVI